MRVNGRLLRPSTLAERRVLKGFGVDCIRVPRNHNPYAVARLLRRLARGSSGELQVIHEVIEQDRLRPPTHPLPWPMPATVPSAPGSPWCPHVEAG